MSIVDFVSRAGHARKAELEEQVEKRKAALGYVLDTSAELLQSLHVAGIGSDKLSSDLRALRRTASLHLQFLEEGHGRV